MTEVRKKRVILVHGIRENAEWFAKVRNALLEAGVDEVETVGYGYFNVFQFLLPGPTRTRAERDVTQQIIQVQLRHPNDELSLIAFSFGTHLAARALLNNPDLKLKHLILCGAVASKRFNWGQIAQQVERRVLNECGVLDPWPLVAETVTVGFSRSGSTGMHRVGVDDRFHEARHQTDFKRDEKPIYFEWADIIAKDAEPSRDSDERCIDGQRDRSAIAWDTLRFSKYQTDYVATWRGEPDEGAPILTDLRTLREIDGDAIRCENAPGAMACQLIRYNVPVNGREARLAWRFRTLPRTFSFEGKLPTQAITFEARLPRAVSRITSPNAAQEPVDQPACRTRGDALVCSYADREGGVLQTWESELQAFGTTPWTCTP